MLVLTDVLPKIAVRAWFVARIPAKIIECRPGQPIKWNLADQAGRFYKPGMELQRAPALRFRPTQYAMKAYIDFTKPPCVCDTPTTYSPSGTPTRGSLNTSDGVNKGLFSPSPTRERGLAPISSTPLWSKSSTKKSICGRAKSTPKSISTKSRKKSTPKSTPKPTTRPGWTGFVEVPIDYIPSGDNLVSETPICLSRTRSGKATPTPAVAAVEQTRSSSRLLARRTRA
jgi:hypothetical protein